MNWLTNFEKAKEEAAKTRKLIFLQFVMDGCGGCKKLEETTYKNEKVITELNEFFILLQLDLINEREIRRMLGAYWTPSFYFLDFNGNSFFHFNGYLPADEFRAMIRIGVVEMLMPRGRYDEIINLIDHNIDELKNTSFYPKLLVAREKARYIKTKDNSKLKELMKEIIHKYPDSTEAKMYFWND